MLPVNQNNCVDKNAESIVSDLCDNESSKYCSHRFKDLHNSNGQSFIVNYNECKKIFSSITSVDEFNNFCNLHPDFELNQKESIGSMSAIVLAAENGNIPLLHHLVDLLGKESLNTGDSSGYTPLAVVCESIDKEGIDHKKLRGAQALIDLGTDLNIRSDDKYSLLAIVAKKSENVMLTALLIEKGALFDNGDFLTNHEWSEIIKSNTDEAKLLSKIQPKIQQFMVGNFDKNSLISQLPKEIAQYIISKQYNVSK